MKRKKIVLFSSNTTYVGVPLVKQVEKLRLASSFFSLPLEMKFFDFGNNIFNKINHKFKLVNIGVGLE